MLAMYTPLRRLTVRTVSRVYIGRAEITLLDTHGGRRWAILAQPPMQILANVPNVPTGWAGHPEAVAWTITPLPFF